MIPNLPYGVIQYDMSHQAPTLHHAPNYGMMQTNFSNASGLNGNNSTTNTSTTGQTNVPTNGSTTPTTSAAALGSTTQQTQGGHQAPTQQSQFQAPPPGMPQFVPYGFGHGYYGQHYYYNPQQFFNRGQPMYQPPPRNMYTADGYVGAAPTITGYDMYGAQSAQFVDSLYGGTMHHHVPGTDRNKNQKNSNQGSTVQQQVHGNNIQPAESYGYPGYGTTYPTRDVSAQWGYNTNSMMYPQTMSQTSGGVAGGVASGVAGGVAGGGGSGFAQVRNGQQDATVRTGTSGNASVGSGFSSSSSAQYVNSRGGNNVPTNTGIPQAGNTPTTNLQTAGW
jgi:hypothetical protein